MTFVKEHFSELELFSRMSCQIGCRADYVQGGGGNTSMKTMDGRMVIKASGYKLSDITPTSGYAVMNYRELAAFYQSTDPALCEDVEKLGGEKAGGATCVCTDLKAVRPSVEAGFHSILDRFVVHTHSVYANFAACAQECDSVLEEALEGAPYSYAVVPYTDPGVRLTFMIRDAVIAAEKKNGVKPQVIIMRNHGLIVHHDDMDQALRIHEDVNVRLATHFGVKISDFPLPVLDVRAEGEYVSRTDYLRERLATGHYSAEMFLNSPLYPDQMVFFKGTLLPSGEELSENSCKMDPVTGEVHYRMKQAQAQTIEETLCAVVFIHETLKNAGLHIQFMGQEARSFIDNWESEKYRKSLLTNK